MEVPGQVHSKLSQTSASSYTPVQLTRDWSRPTKALDVGRLCCGHTVLELSADADRSGWTKAKTHNDINNFSDKTNKLRRNGNRSCPLQLLEERRRGTPSTLIPLQWPRPCVWIFSKFLLQTAQIFAIQQHVGKQDMHVVERDSNKNKKDMTWPDEEVSPSSGSWHGGAVLDIGLWTQSCHHRLQVNRV